MALTVEDGTGVTGADSYGTRAGFIAYVASYYGETIADTDASDAPMRRAFAYLNGQSWKGTRTLGRFQVGAFPRTNLTDCDGNAVGVAEIPQELINAQYELARFELTTPGGLSPTGSLLDAVVTKERVEGAVEVNYDVANLVPSRDNLAPVIDSAMRYVACYLVNGGRSVRMTDAIVV